MSGLIMFAVALLMLLAGFPVAFTFGGVAVFFGLLSEGPEMFSLMPHRIWSIMNNTILMAIPLFIFMGIILQKSKLAERLLESMGFLFGEVRGGIAISTIIVGALLAASTGVVGAIALATMYGRFSIRMIWDSSLETVKITAMVFAILIGATAFSMVFTYTGGDMIVEQFMLGLPGEKWGFLILSMMIIMVLGFFIDFVEISYIVVPILAPIAASLDINPVWYAILVAMNLQTSFLTPPFGFSLFYLKGVAPPEIRTTDIYRGVLPFIILQMIVLGILVIFPQWFGFSPH